MTLKGKYDWVQVFARTAADIRRPGEARRSFR